MKYCKKCGIDYDDTKTFCKECGSQLEVKPVAKYCSACDLEYPADKKFCRECGSTLIDKNVITPDEQVNKVKDNTQQKIVEEKKNDPPEPKTVHPDHKEKEADSSKNKKGNALIFSFSVIVVLIAAVLVYLFVFNSPGEKIEVLKQTYIEDNGGTKNEYYSYVYTEPHTGMKFVEIQGGAYVQGKTPGNYVWGEHTRSIKSFWIGMYEVTQKNWMDVLPNSSKDYDRDNFPITNRTWDEIQEFITELNKITGRQFRLPKEDEWEYAARSEGQYYDFPNGRNDITCSEACFGRDNQNNECLTSYNKYASVQVGSYNPQKYLHIYDMAGNVAELCDDNFTTDGKTKVIRGGSFLSSKKECSVFWRGYIGLSVMKTAPGDQVGFRLVLDVPNLKNELPIERTD